MEILMLLALAGGLAWVWGRMRSLEQRVTEHEAVTDFTSPLPPVKQPENAVDPLSVRFEAEPSDRTVEVAEPVTVDHDAFANMPNGTIGIHQSLMSLRYSFRFDFEEIFGRLLPIWGGGIALAIAGFFLVRWSIDQGMFTQPVRVGISFAFGLGLVGAAELTFRFEHRISDVRVRQALAGAGLASLYASFFLAGSFYALISPTIAFAGLAAVTALAIALSYRFGLPSAVLGLVGGFAAPALAGSAEPNLPLLATYLAMVTAGLTFTAKRQKYVWLGVVALGVSLLWGAIMLIAGKSGNVAIVSVGGYLLLVGTVLPTMLGTGPLGSIGRIGAAGLAVLQIAALVDRSGYSMLAWGCYLLIAAAITILALGFARLREVGAVAAALSICLLAAWQDAPDSSFALIAVANVLIFAAVPLLKIQREQAGGIEWAQLAIYPVALIAATCIAFRLPLLGSHAIAVACAAAILATLPAAGAWIGRAFQGGELAPGPFAAFAATTTLLILAGLLAAPVWCAPLVVGAVALLPAWLMRGRSGILPETLRWGLALVGLGLLLATGHTHETDLLLGHGVTVPDWLSGLRWLAAVVPFCLLLISRPQHAHHAAEALAACLCYGAAAMIVPGAVLPSVVALGLAGLAWRLPSFGSAILTLVLIGALWAAGPLTEWLLAGFAATAGEPFLLHDLPLLSHTLLYVAPLAVGLYGVVLWAPEALGRQRVLGLPAFAALMLIVLHVCYKQLFAIDSLGRFAEYGLAERTVWEATLALAALGLVKLVRERPNIAIAGRGILILALSHFAWFTLFLHNPFWSEQAVGSWPIANLLVPAYGFAIGLVLWLRNHGAASQRIRVVCDSAAMLLIAIFALSELRQVYAGSILLGQITQQEDLLRSILAIVVALAFLAWGAVSRQRSWRICSLVLMLIAVFKVFIFDAAGLEGLARIGSFFVLGICLIGIGWFYSRQLVGNRAPSDAEVNVKAV